MLDTLTTEEQEHIVLQLGKGQRTFTEDDIEIALDWASKVALDAALFEKVMDGSLALSVKNGELYFQSL